MIKEHEQDMLNEMLLSSYVIDNKKITLVSEDSYFRKYFVRNLFDIFLISKTGAVNKKNLKFKNKFIEKLITESQVVKTDLKSYKKDKKGQLKKWDSLKFSIFGFIKTLILSAIYKVISNVKIYLYISLNIMIFISVTTDLERSLFQGIVLFWVLISYVVIDKKILIQAALFFVFPVYILDGIFNNSYQILTYIMKSDTETKSNVELLNLGMFLSLIFYIFMLILETKKKKLRSRFKRFFQRKNLIKAKKEKNFVNFISDILLIVITNLMRNFRFFALLIGLVASLVTVNILNAVLLFFTLAFLWKTKYDAKYWIYYLYYSIFFIPILYSTKFLPKGYSTFNIEVISIIGVYGGTDASCNY